MIIIIKIIIIVIMIKIILIKIIIIKIIIIIIIIIIIVIVMTNSKRRSQVVNFFFSSPRDSVLFQYQTMSE